MMLKRPSGSKERENARSEAARWKRERAAEALESKQHCWTIWRTTGKLAEAGRLFKLE